MINNHWLNYKPAKVIVANVWLANFLGDDLLCSCMCVDRGSPSGQDLGGPLVGCPCIPGGTPEGPGGGMFGPTIPVWGRTEIFHYI